MANSYRQILRSSSIIGGSQVVSMLIGLLRTKIAATILGPIGIGYVGLYGNLIAVASSVFGFGFGNVGTRQIAEAIGSGDSHRVTVARRALLLGTFGLAICGSLAFWSLRGRLAWLITHPELSDEVGWLALGVGLAVASASQTALLRGMRRIGDIARITVLSALASSVVGVAAIYAWGRQGLLIYILAAPFASYALGRLYVTQLPACTSGLHADFHELRSQWGGLFRLGSAVMIASLAATAGALAVRTLVQRELGDASMGHFQAAWAISAQYLGLVLGAMGTDFYPRLAATINDKAAVANLVNQQTEVALLLALPFVLALIGLAPWVVHILYDARFDEAVDVLRWQVLGDVLKVASWPLGIILVASGAGRLLILTEWSATATWVGAATILVPTLGIGAAGLAYFMMYVVHLLLVYQCSRTRVGFSWDGSIKRYLFFAFLIASALCVISTLSSTLGAFIAVCASLLSGLFAVRVLRARDALPSFVERALRKVSKR